MNNRCIKGRFCISSAITFFLLVFFVSMAFGQVACSTEGNNNVNTAVSLNGDLNQEKKSSCGFILLTLDKITLKDLLLYSGPFLTSLLKNSSLV